MDKQEVLEQHALEQLRRGDLRSAHQTLSTLLRYRPNDAQLRNRIQQVEHLVKQREEAQARIQAEPLRYAHAYIQAGRLVEGLKLLRAALAKDPGNQRLRDLALEVAGRLRQQAEASGRPDLARATADLATPGAPNGTNEASRQEAVQRARRSAEVRARSQIPGRAADPARQEAIARARALAEARARGLAEPAAPTTPRPASSTSQPPAPPVTRAPVPEAPSRSMPWAYDLREEVDDEDLEQTEVGPPPEQAIPMPVVQVPEAPTPVPVAVPVAPLDPAGDEPTAEAADPPRDLDVPRSRPANAPLSEDLEDEPMVRPVEAPVSAAEPYDAIPFDPFGPANLAEPPIEAQKFGSQASPTARQVELLHSLLDRVRSRARPNALSPT